ncbi:MAG: hypothetical protein P8X55_00695 [Desulfosarcinaceae bacterium]
MGLIDILENILTPRKEKMRVDLKEIYCKRKDDDFIKQFNTTVVGGELRNVDGSERQDAMMKLKVGQKVRMIWESGEGGKKDKINLLLGGRGHELDISQCFGRLSDKVTADVIRWLTRDNIVTAAKVTRITGGTRKRPKLGCVLQLTTYPGPKKKA